MKLDHQKVPMGELCGLFGMTRQAYYESTWQYDRETETEEIIITLIKSYRKDMPLVGGVKLLHLLKPHLVINEITMGRDKLFRILRENGLLIKRKKYRITTTHSKHWFRKYSNIIKGIEVTKPDQVWVSDIPYLELKKGFCYLAIITDVYSHKIVGFNLSQRLDTINCLEALKMALDGKVSNHPLIHHSDRGVQYCSKDYVALLGKKKVQISMTERGDPYENAIAERINGILKYEFDLKQVFKSFSQAFETTIHGITIYNNQRPHASIDFLTPCEAHKQEGILKKRWKTYYRKLSNNEELIADGF
jgi:putative transposase